MKPVNKIISQTLLAVESSTKACSVSLLHNGISYTEFEIAPQQHANLMLGMVEMVLKKAGIAGESIDFLAFSEGPGAFTGVRIATGVIQGLAYGWDKPVIAISSLEALAWQQHQETSCTRIIACLDARMQEIYLQECEIINGKLHSQQPAMVSAEEATKIVKKLKIVNGIGDIIDEYPAVSQLFNHWKAALPNAEYIAQVASQRQSDAKLLAEKIPLPLYLRNNIVLKKGEQK